MADIRIKDLSSASSSASDDFIAVDGTTNGTRKLNAFSPTFGGNATVGGTLTVTGNTTLSGNLDVASGISTGTAQLQIGNGRTGSGYAYVDLVGDTTYSDYGFRIIRNNGGANTSSELAHRGTGDFALVANDAAPIKFYTNGVTAATIAATTGNTTIHSTSASTSTSSGALVVGNGTSGGLGVGGAIFAGGAFNTSAEVGIIGSNVDFNIISNATNGSVYLKSNGGTLYLNNTAGNGDIRLGNTGNVVIVVGTTASTSTSSGALVVSGGLGVAGAIFAGGNIQCNAVYASNNTTLYLRPQGATVSSGEAQLTTTGNLTLNGSVQTAAPSGGTAAAWKLGTIASVSPTSPNRTIEVDIGGTIYYIHAKTTNN